MWQSARTAVERVTISVSGLPQAYDGTTVAVVADVHARLGAGEASRVKRIVEDVNSLQPDVIVLLGDMIHRTHDASRCLSLLSGLRAGDGVWACLGNHEHGCVWYSRFLGSASGLPTDEWRRIYAEAGIELLVNESKPLQKHGSRIWLVGVDDAYSGCDDLPAALSEVEKDDFCLAITHSPDLIDDPRIAEVGLLLAGHTHGGQVRLPLLGPLYAPCRRARERAGGLIRTNGTTMYVTRGVGEGIPIRLGCPREISLITVRRESDL